MEREDRRGEPGAGDAQAAHDEPREERVGCVQQDVRDVVAQRRVAVDLMLEPEARERERVILRRRARFEPDAREAVRVVERRVVRDVVVVVPDEAGPVRRSVGDEREDDEHQPDG